MCFILLLSLLMLVHVHIHNIIIIFFQLTCRRRRREKNYCLTACYARYVLYALFSLAMYYILSSFSVNLFIYSVDFLCWLLCCAVFRVRRLSLLNFNTIPLCPFVFFLHFFAFIFFCHSKIQKQIFFAAFNPKVAELSDQLFTYINVYFCVYYIFAILFWNARGDRASIRISHWNNNNTGITY